MSLQSLFPSFAAELSIAIGLGALLLGLLLTTRQLTFWLGSSLTPLILTIVSVTLQAFLVLGVALLVFVFIGVNVGWLLLMLAAAFAVGANAYRPKEGGQSDPAVLPTVQTQPVIYPAPVDQEEVQPAAVTQPAVAFTVAEAVAVSDELSAGEESLPVALPESTPTAPVMSAGMSAGMGVAMDAAMPAKLPVEAPADSAFSALSAKISEAPILDTEAQPALPALPVWRPWQNNIPASLMHRRKLGKQTINVLHVS